MIKSAGAAILVLMILAVVFAQQRETTRFARAIPWAQTGVWLKAETHVHTSFSDGGPLDAVIDQAVANGCDVLAITDHTDINLKAATPRITRRSRPHAPGRQDC